MSSAVTVSTDAGASKVDRALRVAVTTMGSHSDRGVSGGVFAAVAAGAVVAAADFASRSALVGSAATGGAGAVAGFAVLVGDRVDSVGGVAGAAV